MKKKLLAGLLAVAMVATMFAGCGKKEELIALRQEEEFKKLYEDWRGEAKIEMNEVLWKAIGFDLEAEGQEIQGFL